MIDLHCHVLPGIDDGPDTIEGSVALARAAAAAGIRTLVATPHVSWRYPNDPENIAWLAEQLRARLAAEGVSIEIRCGAEIAMSRALDLSRTELSLLRMGEGPWLLLEPPFAQEASGLERIVLELQRRGHSVLLAHPERCPAFHRDPLLLESLVGGGVLTSITAGSLAGRFGDQVRRFTLGLARDGLVHNVASDAHDHIRRAPGMSEEIQGAGLGPLAGWLTEEVPSAILCGEAVPPRPADVLAGLARADRRRWWRRLNSGRRP